MPESSAFYEGDNLLAKLSKNKQDYISNLVSDRWRHTTQQPFMQDILKSSEEAWDFYLNNQPNQADIHAMPKGGKKDGFDANRTNKGLRLGLIPRFVDSVRAIFRNSLFPQDERFFRGTPRNEVAREFQELYEQHRADSFAQDNAVEELDKFLLTLCLDRMAAVAVHWRTKTREKTFYEPKVVFKLGGIVVPVPALGLKKRVEKNWVEWEGTAIECLGIDDFRVDLSATKLEEAWFIRRWYEPIWKIEEDYGITDVLPYHASHSQPNTDDPEPYAQTQYDAININPPIPFDSEDEGKKNALLMACYDDFVVGGKVYKNHIAIVLNGNRLIWFGKNPYEHGKKPYIIHSLIPVPNMLAGLSLVHHAIPSAAVFDTAVAKTLKNLSLAADPIFEVDMQEPAFRKTQVIKPGMTIPVKRPGAIRQVQVNVSNISYVQGMLEMILEHMREVTGASPLFTGQDFSSAPANITAFHVNQHVQGASSRFQALMGHFTNNVLEPIMVMAFENDRQFKERVEYIPVGGEEKELTPDLIKQMDFKWIITSAQAAMERGKRIETTRYILENLMPSMVQMGLASLSPDKQIVIHPEVAIKDLLLQGHVSNGPEMFQVVDVPQQMVPPDAMGSPQNGLPTDMGAGGAGQVPSPTEIPPGV